jgi:hypothetical protein
VNHVRHSSCLIVMAGLGPAIHVFPCCTQQ